MASLSLVIQPVLLLYTNDEVLHYDLTSICGDGSKKSLFLGSLGAMVFTYNSTVVNKLSCHLEVHHKIQTDKNLGFYVYIDQMDIALTSDCTRDSLQFGRDRYFVTDRLSQKFCGQMQPPLEVKDEEGTGRVVRYMKTSSMPREWREETDYEFDIWFDLQPSRSQPKSLRLIVTPYRKRCAQEEIDFRQKFARCPGSERCLSQRLFCEGLVKCDVLTSDQWERSCSPKSTGSSSMHLPLAIIIAVFSVIGVTFLALGAKMVFVHFIGAGLTSRRLTEDGPESEMVTRRGVRSGSSSGGSLALRSMAVSPSSPLRGREEGEGGALPPLPPSYTEAVASGAQWKDDPPKYSDIEH